jgi:hypothetical protein
VARLPLSTRTKKLSPEVARRDAWLLQREARIASLEATISELATMFREREAAVRERENRLTDVATGLPGWCPEEKALWMADHIARKGRKTATELGV